MFTFRDEVTIWWPVKVKVPHGKIVGKFETHEFEALFKVIDADEGLARDEARAELLAKADAGTDAGDVVRQIREHDFETWATIVLDWRGVFDTEKVEVPFTSALLVQAVKQPLTRAAIEIAYAEILEGGARRKN